MAFDAKTGKLRWRFNTIPGPGEPGNETWAGDSWKYGGGAAWMTGSYDPELDLLYWGIGNPAADLYGEARKGENLYTDCIVAIDPDTGEVVWHFQEIPHDLWDYDSSYETILIDTVLDGRERKLLLHPNKGGYMYVVDRTNGEFLTAWAFSDFDQLDDGSRRERGPSEPPRAGLGYGDAHLPERRGGAQLESSFVSSKHRVAL